MVSKLLESLHLVSHGLIVSLPRSAERFYFFIFAGLAAMAFVRSSVRDAGVTSKFVENDCMLQDFLRLQGFSRQGRCGEIMVE
jgi:hypothetical protein